MGNDATAHGALNAGFYWARVKLQYNLDRRHSPLGYLAPVDYAQTCNHTLVKIGSYTAWT